MGLTGKYDFKGIQKAGANGLRAALASTVWGAKIVTSPFVRVFDWVAKWLSNWFANKGLVIINLGAYWVNGEFDQAGFDKAMDEGIAKFKANPNMNKTEGEFIDEKVKKVARKFFKYGATKSDK